MIIAAIIVLVGLSMSIVAVEVAELRLSGVLVIPLVALYTLYSVEMLPLFIVSTALAYAAIGIAKRRTLVYGRKTLLIGIVAGAVAWMSLVLGIALFNSIGQQGHGVAFFGSILPGIAAYNYHQLDDSKRVEDLLLSGAALVGLLGLGVALVTPTTAAALGQLTPTILFSPTSDIAILSDTVVFLSTDGVVFPQGLALLVLVLGFSLAEGVYYRWNVRLSGTITLPLLALFTVEFPTMLLFYVVCFGVVFTAITLISWSTLLYGRVLMTVAVLLGTLLAIPLGLLVSTPGFVVLFTSMFGGVAAYNLHRVEPEKRLTATQLSAGVFAGLFGVTWFILTPDPLVTITTVDTGVVAGYLGTLLLATLAVIQLEWRSRLGEVNPL